VLLVVGDGDVERLDAVGSDDLLLDREALSRRVSRGWWTGRQRSCLERGQHQMTT
jgi:hypothetical protein